MLASLFRATQPNVVISSDFERRDCEAVGDDPHGRHFWVALNHLWGGANVVISRPLAMTHISAARSRHRLASESKSRPI